MAYAFHQQTRSGWPHALAAYLVWGFLPLYLLLVRAVPPFEFVAWRIIWSVPICLAIVVALKQSDHVIAALRDRRVLLTLIATALLIGVNWFVYIWAVLRGHVLAASLGYYINPLLNVFLGTVLLKEKLSRRQWIAVALAGIGIVVLLTGAVTTLWISLTLASSFGVYGLLRKQVAVAALPGLTIETMLLLPLSLAIVWFYAVQPAGSSFGQEIGLSAAIIGGGVVTAIPLLLFAIAARRMNYSTLGFVQFIAPTIVVILGLTVFGEALRMSQLICFLFIWTASAIFVWDLLAKRERKPQSGAIRQLSR